MTIYNTGFPVLFKNWSTLFLFALGNASKLVTCKSCEARSASQRFTRDQFACIPQCKQKKGTSILIFMLSDKIHPRRASPLLITTEIAATPLCQKLGQLSRDVMIIVHGYVCISFPILFRRQMYSECIHVNLWWWQIWRFENFQLEIWLFNWRFTSDINKYTLFKEKIAKMTLCFNWRMSFSNWRWPISTGELVLPSGGSHVCILKIVYMERR